MSRTQKEYKLSKATQLVNDKTRVWNKEGGMLKTNRWPLIDFWKNYTVVQVGLIITGWRLN